MKPTSVAKNFIKSERRALAMKQEPAIAAAKKAYRESRLREVDDLLVARSKWQRRQTIANGKLAEIDYELRFLAARHARILDGIKPYTAEERKDVAK